MSPSLSKLPSFDIYMTSTTWTTYIFPPHPFLTVSYQHIPFTSPYYSWNDLSGMNIWKSHQLLLSILQGLLFALRIKQDFFTWPSRFLLLCQPYSTPCSPLVFLSNHTGFLLLLYYFTNIVSCSHLGIHACWSLYLKYVLPRLPNKEMGLGSLPQ